MAEPEIIYPRENHAAYVKLAEVVHPFDLPWNFWSDEARAYFDHLGVPRHEFLETFIATTDPVPAEIADKIARERLRMCLCAWKIITGVPIDGFALRDYWGLPTANDLVAALHTVPVFLRQAGLTFDELRELLQTDYLDGQITLVPADGCDIDAKVLNGLTLDNLDRIHRFLRLRLRAGVSISDLDRMTSTFGVINIDAPFVRNVADLLTLNEELKLPLRELLAFWGNIGTHSSADWGNSLFEDLFLNKAVTTQTTVFASLPVSPASTPTIGEHTAGILAALRISSAEFALLTLSAVSENVIGLPPEVPANAPLYLENLSRMYRVVTLARALGMSLPEFLVLRTLSGITALQGDDGATVTPSMTRRFVKLVHNIRTTSISVNELHYLARHLVPPGTSVGFTDDTIAALVSALETIVNNIHDDILASEAAGAPPLQTKEINARYDQAVLQHIAGAWNVDAVVLEHLLTTVLKSFVFGTKGAIVDFRYATSMVSEAVRIDALKRLAKLVLPTQRLSLSIVEWRLIYPENGQTDWPNLNGIPVQPLSDAPAYRIQFQWLHRLMDLATLRDLLPEKAETLRLIAAAIGRFVANEITESALLDAIATFTGWPREDIEFLMTHGFGYSGLPPAQCDCLEERAFLCLSRALDMLKLLGAKASQASYWSNIDAPCPPPPPQLDVQNIDVAAIALDIKRVVRAKYSLEQWPGVARPIRDVLREKQRDALVHYLLFQLHVEGTNDLYAKLLIDVEMSACQLTSRIKMALGSVQTYVQRVFLGLEAPNATLDEDAASEWSWMKNYRVWEANRKIFLYPENWIEPELRDDKTPFFRTLENRILQGEITAEAVEGAYVEYLESLHEVARLEVAAICREFNEQNSSDRVDIVHVIARTQAAPHRYYYRKRIDSAYWTAWEKVDVEIPGDHLLATVWNRRLYLFWPVFGSAKVTQGNNTTDRLRVDIAWTSWENDHFAKVNVTKNSEIHTLPGVDPRSITLASEKVGDNLVITGMMNNIAKVQGASNGQAQYLTLGVLEASPCTGKTTTQHQEAIKFGWRPRTAAADATQYVEISAAEKVERYPNQASGDDLSIPRVVGASPNAVSQFATLFEKTYMFFPSARYSVVIDRDAKYAMTTTALQNVFTYADPKRTLFAKLIPKATQGVAVGVFDTVQNPPLSLPPVNPDFQTGFDAAVVVWLDLPQLAWQSVNLKEGKYRFQTFYHPYVCDYMRALARDGVDGLLRWSLQGNTPLQLVHEPNNQFELQYVPSADNVAKPYPIENVDFTYGGAYGQYNWELFFHAPLLVAVRLTQNSRFEDADRWYRYIFDPTGGAPGNGPERFWYVKPFRENLDLSSIQAQLEQLAAQSAEAQQIKDVLEAQFDSPGTLDLATQIAVWRENPFQPHVIARMRPIAYQKAVVMKYIDNLLQWGDSLFRRETIEAINEATQLYLLAQNILGKRPRIVKTDDVPPKTYAELEPLIDAFSNALVEVEGVSPPPPNPGSTLPPRVQLPVMRLYFCVPANENMLRLWDTVEDRLFKIRHCQDIEGNVRQLALFEPPIDPALLVRAAAAGVNVGDLLNEVNAPLPIYRFAVLLPKAMEFAGSVMAMGNTLLSILEKRDGEALARLRASQEVELLTRIRAVRQRQIDEAKESLDALQRSRAVIEERLQYYSSREYMNGQELAQQILSGLSLSASVGSGAASAAAGVFKVFPQILAGTGGFVEFGGTQLAGVLEIAAQGAGTLATVFGGFASLAGTQASYQRRSEEWGLQVRLANLELAQIDKQILAAEIRLDIATKELANHETSLANAQAVEDHLSTKFTREELYVWMLERVKTVYFQGYQLAYDMAKRAERTFQFELASTASFVKPGHWNSTQQGLMAGELLQLELRRMDTAYVEQNKREYEITKHVSLAEVAPDKLMQLRGAGKCTLDLLEGHFDMDWRGHYLRRIKTVSLSVPVTNAPYGSVNCKLGITSNAIRTNDRTNASDTYHTDYARAESILTSSGQMDSGLFELVFRDERYLPFEGAGAISNWDISLPQDQNRFDLTTIHDVVMHLRYTARSKNSTARDMTGVNAYRLFSAKTDFPAEWYAFVQGQSGELELPIALRHFQPHLGVAPTKIQRIHLFAQRIDKVAQAVTVVVNDPSGTAVPITQLAQDVVNYGNIVHAQTDPNALNVDIVAETANNFARWKITTTEAQNLDDIWMICTYE